MKSTLILAAILGLASISPPLKGQGRPLDVRGLGFQIPPGVVQQAQGQRVLTNDDDGKPVVGLVHVLVGEHRIVLLPDGKLVARSPQSAPLTERPFRPLKVDRLTEKLSKEFPGFKIRKTKHYVYVYNTSDAFALATGRILETMLPGVTNHSKSQRIATHGIKVPLVAVMFRTHAQFQKYRRMPNSILAYYHTVTNRIVMHEETRLAKVKRDLAIRQSIGTIAHEGVHQILHNIGVQKRISNWPMWLTEGMAEYYAPTSTGRRMRWKGAGQVNDFRMFELENLLKVTDRQPTGKLIEETVLARTLDSTGYAIAWSLTHMLAKTRRSEFNRYVNEVAQLKPLEGGRGAVGNRLPANLVLFKKHFGDDLQKLESDLVKHLRKLPYTDPFAEWPHYLATIAIANGRRPLREANVFHTTKLAEQWLTEKRRRIPDGQRGGARTNIRPYANRAVAENAARVWLKTGR